MTKLKRVTLALALAAGCLASEGGNRAQADTVYLKDGRKLIGTVDEKGSTEDRVQIRTATGVIPIPRANILKIDNGGAKSPAEISGDVAMNSGNFDRALDFYENALTTAPDDKDLQAKIAEMHKRIDDRDRAAYGAAFDAIEQMLKQEKFEEAISSATPQAMRAKPLPSVALRFNQMICRAHLGLALKYQDRVDYPSAEKEFRAALAADPDSVSGNLELADLLEQTPSGKAAALPLLERGIELGSKEPDLVLGKGKTLLEYEHSLGVIHMQNRNFAEAADVFLDLARKDTANAYPQSFDQAVEAYSQIPSIESVKGLDHIIGNLKLIIKAKPETKKASLLLGRIYFARSDWKDARDTFSDAVRPQAAADPALQDMLYFLGICDRRLGDLPGAAECFQTLVDQHAANYNTLCELAEIRLQQAGYEQAIDLFTQARTMDHDKYRAYLGLGDALIPLERYDEARTNYLEVVARDPHNHRAQLEIGKTYFMETKVDQALDAAQQTIDGLLKDDADTSSTDRQKILAGAYTLAGQARLSSNQINVARESFNKALTANPASSAAMEGEGKTYQAEGRHPEAQAWFQKAIDADPKNPDYRLSLAINYHKYQKDTAKALPNYMAYMELGGKDPNVRRWIADCGGTPPGS